MLPYRSVESLLKYGVVALDKPPGPTSHQVAAWVKKMLALEKVGHGGTLDPNVSGVLVLGLNNALRVIHLLHKEPKEYVGVMRLHGSVGKKALEAVFSEFATEIYQLPPVRSAVKRRLRKRRIYDLQIIEVEGRDVLFRAKVEAGVYIRALCRDLGEALGVGANMQELRRTASGVFGEDMAVTLHELMDAYVFWKEDGDEKYIRKAVRPVEFMLQPYPKIMIKDSAVDAICHGAALMAPGVLEVDSRVKAGECIVLATRRGEAVAIARALGDAASIAAATQGAVAEIKRVIMDRGTYPRLWRRSEKAV